MKITCTNKRNHDPRMYSDSGYWFSTTHGVMPGSIPSDVEILDIIYCPSKTFVKFDRFLTTSELNEFDMKEEVPEVDGTDNTIYFADMCNGSDEIEVEAADPICGYDFGDWLKEFTDVPSIDSLSDSEYDSYYSDYKDWLAPNDYSILCNDDSTGESIQHKIETKMKKYFAMNDMEYMDDYSSVEVSPSDDPDYLCIRVYAELDFDDMVDLADVLDSVVSKMDNEAYFDQEDPGVMIAFVKKPSSGVVASYDIDDARDSYLYSEEPEDEEVEPFSYEIEIDVDTDVILNSDNSWDYADTSWADPDSRSGRWEADTRYGTIELCDADSMVEIIDDMIESKLPSYVGTFHISFKAVVVFDIYNIYITREYYDKYENSVDREYYTDDADYDFNFSASSVSNFKITKK